MSTTGHEKEAVNVEGLKAALKSGGNKAIFNEAICSTAGGTAAKVTNTTPPSFSLVSGAKIIVKFTYGINVANSTLQVGETAAKPIHFRGAALEANIVKPATHLLLSYDGTAYNIIGGLGGGSEVEIGETTPTEDVKLFVDEDADPAVTLDVYTRAQTDALLAAKADESTTLNGYGITDAYTKTQIDALTRHTRLTDFDLSVLQQAVADGNLEKYGLKVGDEKTINGHTYVIAGLNPMKGTATPYRVITNHVGLIVIPHTTQAWNVSGNTYTGADGRGAGYLNSDLHYYLKNTVLPMCNTDLGADNLISHSKLLSNAVNTSGYNKLGEASGCASGWTWVDTKICALSEAQVYGAAICSSSLFDTGEAYRQLDVFQRYSPTEIFGNEYPWLRDVVSASSAASVSYAGDAGYGAASYADYAAALILFK